MLSGACKREKLSDIARIGRLQGIDIAPPKVAGSHRIPQPQVKTGRPRLWASTSAIKRAWRPVAVGEGMDQNQAVDESAQPVHREGRFRVPPNSAHHASTAPSRSLIS